MTIHLELLPDLARKATAKEGFGAFFERAAINAFLIGVRRKGNHGLMVLFSFCPE